jgi:hypothetical protein
MRKALSVNGKQMCRSCAEEYIRKNPDTRQDEVSPCLDPTICENCGRDGGTHEHEKLAGVPVCPQCKHFFSNRPFPFWIKMASLALAGLVIFATLWNARYALAYMEFKKCMIEGSQGNIAAAVTLSSSAASRVPESVDLKAFADYFAGFQFLIEGKSRAALARFHACKTVLPQGYGVSGLIDKAEIGAAFDEKNYDRFLALALAQEKAAPDNPIIAASIASAYACKYADTGISEFRDKANGYLKKATDLAGSEGIGDYEMRILYRLYSKEILTNEEYTKKFPNGWKPEMETE